MQPFVEGFYAMMSVTKYSCMPLCKSHCQIVFVCELPLFAYSEPRRRIHIGLVHVIRVNERHIFLSHSTRRACQGSTLPAQEHQYEHSPLRIAASQVTQVKTLNLPGYLKLGWKQLIIHKSRHIANG